MTAIPEAKKREGGGVAETVRVVVHALIIALVIRTFLFQPFNIPSGSMKETLLVGDYLFVSKFSYGYSHYAFPWPVDAAYAAVTDGAANSCRFVVAGVRRIASTATPSADFCDGLRSPKLFSGRVWSGTPKRGDVVVFRLPKDDNVDYIKRVIGLPGDRIQMMDGVLHINDVPVKRERISDWIDTEEGGRRTVVKRWQETLPNGVSYTTLDMYDGHGFLDNTQVYEVPPGNYFMMGDNRDNSQDSRVLSAVGYVPLENMVGRAQIIFFSIGEGEYAWQIWRWPWTVRWNRLFQMVP